MRILRPFLVAAAVFVCGQAALADDVPLSAPPPPMTADGQALLDRAMSVNAGIKTLQADLHVDVEFKSFPFIKHTLSGSYFYKQPNKQAVVFDEVPLIAKEFKKVYPRLDPPADWSATYTYGVLSSASGLTTFRLVPIKNGRVEHLDVFVDEESATITGYAWTYKDGGYIAFAQTMTQDANGNYLVTSQTGHVVLPAYKVDTVAEYSNYRLNVEVEDKVFQE